MVWWKWVLFIYGGIWMLSFLFGNLMVLLGSVFHIPNCKKIGSYCSGICWYGAIAIMPVGIVFVLIACIYALFV